MNRFPFLSYLILVLSLVSTQTSWAQLANTYSKQQLDNRLSSKLSNLGSTTAFVGLTDERVFFDGSEWILKTGSFSANGGTIIAGGGGKYYQRKYTGDVNVQWFGAKADGTTNNTTAIDNAIKNTPSGGRLFFPAGNYVLNKVRILRSDITFVGEPGTMLTSVDRYVFELGNVSNIMFSDIKFRSSQNSTVTDYFALIYAWNRVTSNIRFVRCGFTAPTCATNGIKFITDSVSTSTRNILIDDCDFYELGKMGIEIQSHLNDGVERYGDITIRKSRFKNTGLVITDNDDHYGMAVSFSGSGTHVFVDDNTVDNPYDIGLEFTGGVNHTRVRGNRFVNISRMNIEFNRPLSLISFSVGDGVNVSDNICSDSLSVCSAFFRSLTNAEITNNIFMLSGYLTVRTCTGTTWINNTIKTKGVYGILLERSGSNVFENNRISCTATNLISAIRADGAEASNNVIRSGSITKVAGSFLDGVNTSANNQLFAVKTNTTITTSQPTLTNSSNLADLVSVSSARTNLGLGTMALQNNTGVSISGGTISGITINGGTLTGGIAHENVYPGSDGAGNVGGVGKAWSLVHTTRLNSETLSERYAGSHISFKLFDGTTAGRVNASTGNLIVQKGGTITDNGLDKVQVTGSVTFRFASGSGTPTSSRLPDGYVLLWKNTSDGTIKWYVNDGGTIKAGAAFTE